MSNAPGYGPSASGRTYPLPQPRGGASPLAFWAAVDEAEKRDTLDDGQERKTFGALVDAYKQSRAYTKLAGGAPRLQPPSAHDRRGMA